MDLPAPRAHHSHVFFIMAPSEETNTGTEISWLSNHSDRKGSTMTTLAKFTSPANRLPTEGLQQRARQIYKEGQSGWTPLSSLLLSLSLSLFGQCSTSFFFPTLKLASPSTFPCVSGDVRPCQDLPARSLSFWCTGCTDAHQAHRPSYL